jgi:hypothetical protein
MIEIAFVGHILAAASTESRSSPTSDIIFALGLKNLFFSTTKTLGARGLTATECQAKRRLYYNLKTTIDVLLQPFLETTFFIYSDIFHIVYFFFFVQIALFPKLELTKNQ